MTILIGLFISNVRSADEQWWVVAKGLMGIWQPISLLRPYCMYLESGVVLFVQAWEEFWPNSLLTSSAFFDSIGMRSFGGIEESLTDGTSRLSALALDYGGLASIIIFCCHSFFWYGWQKRRLLDGFFSAIFIGLVLAFVFAQVRSVHLTPLR